MRIWSRANPTLEMPPYVIGLLEVKLESMPGALKEQASALQMRLCDVDRVAVT